MQKIRLNLLGCFWTNLVTVSKSADSFYTVKPQKEHALLRFFYCNKFVITSIRKLTQVFTGLATKEVLCIRNKGS